MNIALYPLPLRLLGYNQAISSVLLSNIVADVDVSIPDLIGGIAVK